MTKFLIAFLKWLGISLLVWAGIFIYGLIEERYVNRGLLDWIFDDYGIWWLIGGEILLLICLYNMEDE